MQFRWRIFAKLPGKTTHYLIWSGLQVLTATSLLAGGAYTPTRIGRFDLISETKHIVVVSLSEDSYFFGKCREATLLLDFEPEWFWKRKWGKDRLSRENYDHAIAVLKSAHAANQGINIGAMGDGFAPVSGKACTFQSYGLFVDTVTSKTDVYSLHY